MKHCPSCSRITRRDLLAGAGGFAALLAMAQRGEAQVTSRRAETAGTAECCIFINLQGAPSHVDTFDLKPAWAQRDYSIDQSGSLILSRRLFPKLFTLAGDLCVVRSIESWEAAHERGQFYLQTGHSSNPAFNGETPHIGAIVAFERKTDGKFPPFLSLNGRPSQGSQFLGGDVDPVAPVADPRGFSTLIHDFAVSPSEQQQRFEQKFQMLSEMDAAARQAPYDPLLAAHAAYYGIAKKMMYDDAIGDVFKMSLEERERFGDTEFGRSCIIARNAVRAASGIRFINIQHDGWDMHKDLNSYGPLGIYQKSNELDRGLGALIEDLKASGHFATTLIVMMGEFGRTPGPLNGQRGRDHHKGALFSVFAGGGAAGGRILGSTDAKGEKIFEFGWSENRAVYMEDITATVFSALGIDWTKTITDTPSGRTFQYVAPSPLYVHTSIREVFA